MGDTDYELVRARPHFLNFKHTSVNNMGLDFSTSLLLLTLWALGLTTEAIWDLRAMHSFQGCTKLSSSSLNRQNLSSPQHHAPTPEKRK